jgi:hypothetical protein
MKELAMEFQKIRRRKLWLTVAVMLGAQCLWGFWSFRNIAPQRLYQGFRMCLYHFPMLNAIMMPVIIAVVASRLCDVEHKGQTLKLLQTVMPAGRLFDAKFLCGALYIIAAGLAQVIMIIIIGNVNGFLEPLPADRLFFYLVFTTAVNLTILVLQQVLSLLFVNQMVPLAVGLIGSFAGLFSMFFPQGFQKLILWGYYGVMIQVGMNWDKDTRIVDLYYVPIDWTGFLLLGMMFVVIYMAGRMIFVRKEL